jgi:hypothetical protein
VTVPGARAKIEARVLAWPGVTVHPHRFGGSEYRYGARRELGHIHGDHLVDIPLPTRLRDEVIAAGRAQPHHILPESGWVSKFLRQPADVDEAVALLRLSYDVAARQRGDTAPDQP